MPYKSLEDRRQNARKQNARARAEYGCSWSTLWRRKHPGRDAEYKRRDFQKHKAERQETNKLRLRVLRLLVISFYGGECECCGEREVRFLSFDHKDNSGAEHRRNKMTYWSYHKWLLAERRSNMRLLCYNCNCSRGFFGKCPHED